MKVCDNCGRGLNVKWKNEDGTRNLDGAYPIGPDQGSQRDSYRKSIDLCATCRTFLEDGDFDGLQRRRESS